MHAGALILRFADGFTAPMDSLSTKDRAVLVPGKDKRTRGTSTADVDQVSHHQELLHLFNNGHFTIFRTWRPPLQAIVLRLMDIIVLNQVCSSEDAITAFLLLPAIIHVNQLYKSKKCPTFQLLT